MVSNVDPYAPETVAVYQLYDARAQVLYVGQADNPKARFITHSKEADWWPEVACWAVEWWPSRAAARAEERRLIAERSPIYNIAGNNFQQAARVRRLRRPGGLLADVHEVLRGESYVRTMVVLGRLAAKRPDVYGEWGAGDLKALLAGYGVAVRKRMSGQSCIALEEVETALRERREPVEMIYISAGQASESAVH